MLSLLVLSLLPQTQSFVSTQRCVRLPNIHVSKVEASVPFIDSADPISNFPDQDVVARNIQAHMEAVRQSEEKFYGFYPDGFTEFDVENAPSSWTSYALDSREDSLNEYSVYSPATQQSIWDTFNQLDERIIPPPFTSNDLARVSKTPILTPQECQEIINECESHYWGWSSSTERYGTPSHRVGHMLKLEDLSRSYSLVNFDLLPRLYSGIMDAFPLLETNAQNFRLGGSRVVKYDAADGRVELGLHRDGLLITANIALNDWDEYEGGGTYVEGLPSFMNNPIRLQKGHCLLHPGDVRHGGAPITMGVRYVLVLFILDTSIIPHEKYCQDRMKQDVEAARLIPSDDVTRSKERNKLLESATKHCADAYAFGRMSCGESSNGYDEIVRVFNKFVEKTAV
jgi:predicted 2-oxoglutarate/Fe(II)-dependent dioxygenase YbiX